MPLSRVKLWRRAAVSQKNCRLSKTLITRREPLDATTHTRLRGSTTIAIASLPRAQVLSPPTSLLDGTSVQRQFHLAAAYETQRRNRFGDGRSTRIRPRRNLP